MRKLFKKQGELKGPSLTIKWAFTSSFFIFVVFTIFAVITYKSSINLIVAKERNNVEQTISDVSSRLANSDEELTLVNTYRTLTESSNLDNALYDRNMTLEGNMLRIDSFVAELGQTQLSLDIYNLDEKLIFKTQEVYHPLVQTEHKSPTIVTLDEKNGFLSIEPIYSKETRERIGYAQIFYELSDFYEMRSKLLITLIVLEIVSLVLSSFLGFLLSSYFLKPVKILRDTMEIIRQDPQADVHVPEITTNDELADLAMIFNDVIDRIRMYIKQQEQFVEDVSHELRTPVAVIEGHLSLLNRWGKDDPEILEESIQASLQEIERMKSLVQEMLDLSRAEQVDVYYGNEVSNAKEVTYQVFNNFKLLYPEFTFTLDDDLENERQLKIYRNHLEQIMIIIMDNAVKYSTDRKEVHISISSTLNEFEIAIQDFGEGIPDEDIDKVFNRFYRVDKARARTKGGNGLGLSIAHKLIESYKGHISVESSIGQGTIFRIFIPMMEEESAEQ
ncbi:HAMP domain-containing histidine kinase [Enterococcus sp. 669A]|uniref:Signal transduction histidine-protein kinase ArlS n=1 Tax=Candidatus Enterococcus moelleringii TaxID=2815325 RepID=A0ABS3LCI9_9ENTE|nr:HAMP domain-containing histidine kinase [Enterococcus sp. 669A]MBO1307348.1 HAMP domain-containing histidine kinase [Enterococcus sp. 669A]